MAAAYIEHTPSPSDPRARIAHHAVVVGGQEVRTFRTLKEGADWAITEGYKPAHVAREQHLQNRDRRDHWRRDL
jgi:hypothetical protein